MDEEVTRILALARDFPLLGIDALRARQIAEECTNLHAACAAATQRFRAGDAAQFAARFAAPPFGALPE